MQKIWSTYSIKGKIIPNRLVFPPIATEKFHLDDALSQLKEHYKSIAFSGVGTVIVEHSFVSPEGKFSPGQLSISNDEDMAVHRQIVQVIKQGGAVSALQLNHAGAHCLASLQPDLCLSPSSVRRASGEVPLKSMDKNDIEQVINAFSAAATRAVQSGYDMIEIHCAHGFLLSQFLSPLCNHRQDEYGGTLNGRMRLLMELVEAIQAKIPEEILLAVRLGISDQAPDQPQACEGLTLQEGLKVAQNLQQKGIDILDLSGGLCGSRPAECSSQGYFLPFAQAVKESGMKVPTIITGGITDLVFATSVIEEGISDFVGIGRALYQDHLWLKKEKNK